MMYVDLQANVPLDYLHSTGYLAKLALSGKYAAILHNIVRSDRELRWVAERSYSHVNGFDKIVIGESHEGGRKIVLHKWNSVVNNKQIEVEIHNHRWSFVSYVLRGGIENRSFVITEDRGEFFRHYRYSSPGTLDSFSLEYIRDVVLAECGSCIRSRGVSYYQPRDEVHCAIAIASETETLIIQDNATRQYTDVFSKLELKSAKREVARFSTERVQRSLQKCIEQLEK